jgi:hypothetical protein
MSPLLDLYRRTGRRPTLIDKIEAEESLDELNGMQMSCGARGQELTIDEIEAFARRRAELKKAARP